MEALRKDGGFGLFSTLAVCFGISLLAVCGTVVAQLYAETTTYRTLQMQVDWASRTEAIRLLKSMEMGTYPSGVSSTVLDQFSLHDSASKNSNGIWTVQVQAVDNRSGANNAVQFTYDSVNHSLQGWQGNIAVVSSS